jgi:hypothetical protein
MNLDSEFYTFIGFQYNTYFFIHTIHNQKFNNKISYQIYNVLLDDGIITEPNKNIVIYEFNEINNLCNAVCIQHKNNPNYIDFDKNNLEDFISILLKVPRNDLYAIEYNYNIQNYETYYADENIENSYLELPTEKLTINELYNIVIKNLFNYT